MDNIKYHIGNNVYVNYGITPEIVNYSEFKLVYICEVTNTQSAVTPSKLNISNILPRDKDGYYKRLDTNLNFYSTRTLFHYIPPNIYKQFINYNKKVVIYATYTLKKTNK
jgi:hypothetical protein